MGDSDQTELAPTETDTASVWAWALDDDDEPPATHLTPGRITAAAVAASLLAIAAAGLLGWQHLRTEAPTPAAATSMVTATVAVTPTTAPPPPQVDTTGWGIPKRMVPPPTKTVTVAPPPPDMTAAMDRRFITSLESQGWDVWDPTAATRQAHLVCLELQNSTMDQVMQRLIPEARDAGIYNPEVSAQQFANTVLATYACQT